MARAACSVASLGSGSRGNSFLVESTANRILVDAGFSGVQLERRLRELGVEPESIDLVVITHEHTDHVHGAGIGARRWGWTLAMNGPTRAQCSGILKGEETCVDLPSSGLKVGDLTIEPVPTIHDAAAPVAIVVKHRKAGLRVGIATDIGRPTTAVRHALQECDFLVLEANHDERWLRMGPYPWSVKQRIGGSRGHLSNRHAADLAAELAHPGLGGILLAHLSHECNDPARAHGEVTSSLGKVGYTGLVETAAQDSPSPRYDVGRIATARYTQLSLL